MVSSHQSRYFTPIIITRLGARLTAIEPVFAPVGTHNFWERLPGAPTVPACPVPEEAIYRKFRGQGCSALPRHLDLVNPSGYYRIYVRGGPSPTFFIVLS